MPDRKFDLGDYVEVKDRIRIFYELFAQGRLVTDRVFPSSEPDGVPRVWVKALAYRTPDDPLPGVGWSWMELPGKTSYTKGSEIENTETSAWGRAIGALGILIDKSIASAQEVDNKRTDAGGLVYPEQARPRYPKDDGSLIGTVEVGKARDSDYELRETPDGWGLGFKLKSNGGGFKVLTRDELALQMLDAKTEVVGSRVTVWGRVRDETFKNKAGRDITYQVIDAERIKTSLGVLPILKTASPKRHGDEPAPDEPEPIPVAEGQESLFDPAESARLDAEEAAK